MRKTQDFGLTSFDRLSLATTSATSAVRRGQREFDVLLAVQTHGERGHVDQALANTTEETAKK